jgi:hypothetical protein
MPKIVSHFMIRIVRFWRSLTKRPAAVASAGRRYGDGGVRLTMRDRSITDPDRSA